MRAEISQNLGTIASLRQQIAEQQKQLDIDLKVLGDMRSHPETKHGQLSFGFGLQGFNDVAWKTAQSTGAMGYMPYQEARTYSDVYGMQAEVYEAEKLVVSDVLKAASFPSTQGDDWRPSPPQIDDLTDRVGELRMRLMLLDSLVHALDQTYQQFQRESK